MDSLAASWEGSPGTKKHKRKEVKGTEEGKKTEKRRTGSWSPAGMGKGGTCRPLEML